MNNIQWDNMKDEFTDEDLFDCLTDEEKEKIEGKMIKLILFKI